MFIRLLYILLFVTSSGSLSFAQKIFEGKLSGEIKWEKVPLAMKSFVSPGTYITYYKKDKSRTESTASNYTAVTIDDYTIGKRLMLMDMNIGGRQRTATISYITPADLTKIDIEKTGEYKILLNHNCQKIIMTSVVGGKETKATSYVHSDFLINSFSDASGPTYVGLPMETSMEMPTGIMKMVTTQFSEEAVSEDLFNFIIPAGYKVTDLTKKSQSSPNIISSTTSSTTTKPATAVPVKKFTNIPDTELQKLLSEALKKEDFETAQALKEEMDARKKASAGKYGAYSTAELNKILNEAVSKEDFTAAQEIKKELDSRQNK